MAKFADTPDWKRGRWDPDAGCLRYPERAATKKQRMFVAGLCRRNGVPVVKPKTQGEVSRLIDELRDAA